MNANSTLNGGDLFCLVGMGYIVFICLNGPQSPTFFLSTEASGSIGYGVFYSWEWFNGAWSVAQQSLSIAYKELFPIVLSCYVWGGGEWRNRRIQFDCDNQSVAVNSGTSKDSHIMKLVRQLFLCAARMNFTIIAKHVPGKDNNIADSLSRFSMQVFRQLAPRAHLTPVMVPPAVLARLDWPWDRSSTNCV